METVIVLSASTPGLGVIRALGRHGVPIVVGYHDPWDIAQKSKYVQKKYWMPDPESEEKGYIDCLLQDRIGDPGMVLMPTSDATLRIVSRNKKTLQQKYRVACPDWDITEKFLDKKFTYNIAEAAGVPAPKTFLPHSVEDIEACASTLRFPCLAKPSLVHVYNWHFQKKMTLAENMDELIKAFQEAESVGVEIMVQEFIPGEDHLGANYNAYYWEGEPRCEFTAHKIRNAPPWLGSPSVLISEKIPEVVEMGRSLLSSVGYSGYACTEFKRDPRDGTYKLMEVNVRHNLSSLLSVSCGLNFPWMEYQHLVDGIKPQPQDFETGVYWIDMFRDFGARVFNKEKPAYTLSQMLSPYFHNHVSAFFDWKDIKPFLRRTKNFVLGTFSFIKSNKSNTDQ